MCLLWAIQSLDQIVNSELSKLAQPFDSFLIDLFEQDSRPPDHFQERRDDTSITKASHDRDHLRCKLSMYRGIFNQPVKKRSEATDNFPLYFCRDTPIFSEFVQQMDQALQPCPGRLGMRTNIEKFITNGSDTALSNLPQCISCNLDNILRGCRSKKCLEQWVSTLLLQTERSSQLILYAGCGLIKLLEQEL